MPNGCINLTYATAVAITRPCQEQSAIQSTSAPDPSIAQNVTHDAIYITSNDNSSHLPELETSLQSIHSGCISMQSDHQSLRADFQKVIFGVLQHSKAIQAMQIDMHSLNPDITKRNALARVDVNIGGCITPLTTKDEIEDHLLKYNPKPTGLPVLLNLDTLALEELSVLHETRHLQNRS
jgi:hypothetical protein